MAGAVAGPGWTTDQLKEMLFEDRWHRQFFIEEFIVLDEPENAMPWDVREQRPDLGAILVDCDEDAFDPYDEFAIVGEYAFIDATEIDSKRQAAYTWVKEIAARGIATGVAVYTIAADGHDFETLEWLPLPWFPGQVNPGDRIRYDGIAYPFPGARGIRLHAEGVFEITDLISDGFRTWIELRDVDSGDAVAIDDNLILAAEFL